MKLIYQMLKTVISYKIPIWNIFVCVCVCKVICTLGVIKKILKFNAMCSKKIWKPIVNRINNPLSIKYSVSESLKLSIISQNNVYLSTRIKKINHRIKWKKIAKWCILYDSLRKKMKRSFFGRSKIGAYFMSANDVYLKA